MPPNEFKWKHFAPTIILWCLRWYGSTPLSYANVSDMLAERGFPFTAQRFIVGLLNMLPFSVKNSKNINSFGLFPPSSSMKPMSK